MSQHFVGEEYVIDLLKAASTIECLEFVIFAYRVRYDGFPAIVLVNELSEQAMRTELGMPHEPVRYLGVQVAFAQMVQIQLKEALKYGPPIMIARGASGAFIL